MTDKNICFWEYDKSYPESWRTDCNKSYFVEDGYFPDEVKAFEHTEFVYCPYCGNKIRIER